MKYYKIKSPKNIYDILHSQCKGIKSIEEAFILAWKSFKKEGWNYDGATFVRENKDKFWEVAAFIHDWLNQEGYVGKEVDLYFIKIMISLNYSVNIIFERCKWMQWTWLNVFWHKVKGNYKGNKIPNNLKP